MSLFKCACWLPNAPYLRASHLNRNASLEFCNIEEMVRADRAGKHQGECEQADGQMWRTSQIN